MGVFHGVELDDLQLRSERLLLRPWQPDDAEHVHAVMQDPSMFAFLPLPRPYPLEQAQAYIAGHARAGRAAGDRLTCAVLERAGGRLVGSAEIYLSDDPHLGYWVAREARGHGYAAEASRALARWAFNVGIARVRIECEVGNVASARSAMAAGFAFEGISAGRVHSSGRGGPRDLAVFARRADDPDEPISPVFPALPSPGPDDGVVRLRASVAEDAAARFAAEDDVSVGWGFTAEPPDAARYARNLAQAGLQWLVGPMARIAIEDVATGSYAGEVQLRRSGPPQIGSLGYTVHPAFRGRGYTARALRLLAPWAFGVADFARLELGAKLANVASQRAALAAGYERDGVLRCRLRNPDGTFSDEARFALLNPRYA